MIAGLTQLEHANDQSLKQGYWVVHAVSAAEQWKGDFGGTKMHLSVFGKMMIPRRRLLNCPRHFFYYEELDEEDV